jgi:hypothetical protein
MLQKLTAYLLILSILAAGFSRYVIYAGFALNKQYIANTLCENKDKPKLQCHGKCYLMKKVKQAEEKEKQEERSNQKGKYQEAFLNTASQLTIPIIEAVNNFSTLLPEATIKKSFSIFHPPSFA